MLDTNSRAHSELALPWIHTFHEDRVHAASLTTNPRRFLRTLCQALPRSVPAAVNKEYRLSYMNSLDVDVGKAERTPSGSWFNGPETEVVRKLVQRLLRISGIYPDNILVLTGYRAQIRQLKSLADAQGWTEMNIKTIDASQGAESKIVIISLVRTSDNLGFLIS